MPPPKTDVHVLESLVAVVVLLVSILMGPAGLILGFMWEAMTSVMGTDRSGETFVDL